MNKKEMIIEAALKLLVVNGIHATPMSAIAKAANTGMGTIYNYFTNKEILINAIYVEIKRSEETLLSVPSNKKTIKSQFEHYYLTVTDFYVDNPVYFQFIEQLQNSPIITAESKAIGYEAIETVIQVLKKGQKEKLIKKIPIEELLQFLGGSVVAHARWAINNRDKKRSTNNQLHLVWDAIKV